ncbi:hypothetical protein C2845_PM04G15780 [Panicum miliaceum]|uniref:Uncharacterized protein n=1 Tax=Panicum miliaceum TaxID=4540 RepID=A0A3L6QU47_PANMI|nr:hypothetical protein C2845_PM04G15780 [Panicum miliaceum]
MPRSHARRRPSPATAGQARPPPVSASPPTAPRPTGGCRLSPPWQARRRPYPAAAPPISGLHPAAPRLGRRSPTPPFFSVLEFVHQQVSRSVTRRGYSYFQRPTLPSGPTHALSHTAGDTHTYSNATRLHFLVSAAPRVTRPRQRHPSPAKARRRPHPRTGGEAWASGPAPLLPVAARPQGTTPPLLAAAGHEARAQPARRRRSLPRPAASCGSTRRQREMATGAREAAAGTGRPRERTAAAGDGRGSAKPRWNRPPGARLAEEARRPPPVSTPPPAASCLGRRSPLVPAADQACACYGAIPSRAGLLSAGCIGHADELSPAAACFVNQSTPSPALELESEMEFLPGTCIFLKYFFSSVS